MAIADRARDYWDRISPRERKLVVFLAAVVPLSLTLWLGLAIRDGLVDMEKRNQDTRDALEIVERIRVNGIDTHQNAGPKIPDQPIPLETYVSKAAEKVGLAFKGSIDTRKATKNGFVTTTVSCALDNVSTEQLRAFLQDVESGEKIVAVTHLSVKRDWRDKEKLDANLEISTYSNAEKKKSEDKGDDKAGSEDKKGS